MMDRARSAIAISSIRDVFSLKKRIEKPSVINSSTCPTARTDATFSSEKCCEPTGCCYGAKQANWPSRSPVCEGQSKFTLAIRNMIPPMKSVCNNVDVIADMEALSTISPVASESVAARKLTVDSPRNAPAASPRRDCFEHRDVNRLDRPDIRFVKRQHQNRQHCQWQ